MADLDFKQGEAKTVTFTVKDDGTAVDVSGASSIKFEIKDEINDDTAKVTKTLSDFNTSQASSGIVKVNLSSTDTDLVGEYYGELKVTLSNSDIDKSQTYTVWFERALT